MDKIQKKYKVKIPSNITFLYFSTKQVITVIGPLIQKSLTVKLQIKILKNEHAIYVTSTPIEQVSNYQLKKMKTLRGTTVSLIKQLFIETSAIIYQKLNFIGVGYRSFLIDNYEKQILMLKLGYSHLIFIKIPNVLHIFCLKLTKLFIFGHSYPQVTKISAEIQSHKLPEPYKGKGILYENQTVILKEGKKV